jgi:hypothetical protein
LSELEFTASVTRFTKTNLRDDDDDDDDDENDAVRANQPTAHRSIYEYINIVLFIKGISNSAGVFIGENRVVSRYSTACSVV